MNGFELCFTTKIIFGKDAETCIGKKLKEEGVARVLLHYDDIAEKLGLLQRVGSYLEEEGIETVRHGGVVPNTSLSVIRAGIRKCLDCKVDCVVAIGGGSTMDSAKAICVGAANPDVDIWECYEGTFKPVKALKMAVVQTTAATGSETNASSVVMNEDGNLKRSLYCEASRADYAFMNPEILYTLPRFQRACTIADILSHTFERYFTQHGENEISDQCAEGLMRTLYRISGTFLDEARDYQSASEIMWAGTSAYLYCGLGGPFDWGTHNMGHELSGMFEKTHAATITALWPSWTRYTYTGNIDRYARYATHVLGLPASTPAQQAKAAIDLTESYFRTWGLPTTLPALIGRPLTPQELDLLTDNCMFHGKRQTVGNHTKLTRPEVHQIYTLANH